MHANISKYDMGVIAHRINLGFAQDSDLRKTISNPPEYVKEVIEKLLKLQIYNATKEEAYEYMRVVTVGDLVARYNPYLAYAHLLVTIRTNGLDLIRNYPADVMAICPHLDRGHLDAFKEAVEKDHSVNELSVL